MHWREVSPRPDPQLSQYALETTHKRLLSKCSGLWEEIALHNKGKWCLGIVLSYVLFCSLQRSFIFSLGLGLKAVAVFLDVIVFFQLLSSNRELRAMRLLYVVLCHALVAKKDTETGSITATDASPLGLPGGIPTRIAAYRNIPQAVPLEHPHEKGIAKRES